MAKPYDKKELKVLASILRSARTLLRQKKQNWICFAIGSAVEQMRKRSTDLFYQSACDRDDDYLCHWVHRSMNIGRKRNEEYFAYYHNWIKKHHPEILQPHQENDDDVITVLTVDYMDEILRPGRIAWVTWMIEQLEQEIAAMP